jgi:2-polyprenyl-3-methyl-5-hydroxy-6-metoxy-1,4-benzoquinol methylase
LHDGGFNVADQHRIRYRSFFKAGEVGKLVDQKTLERIVPDDVSLGDATGTETLKLHLERYEFAAQNLRGGRILDMACGVGYGTALLKEKLPSASVFGVDISSDAISYAKARYGLNGIEFSVADATKFVAEPFDAIVSLETIEHLPSPHNFVQHCVRALLKPGGIFVGSVPVTPSVDANPHHMTDFTEKSFRALLKEAGLKEFNSLQQKQPYNPIRILSRAEKRMEGMRKGLLYYYIKEPKQAFLRAKSIVIDGFNNKYLTVASTRD